MACIHIRIKGTFAPYNGGSTTPVTTQAFWQIWVVHPMLEWDEDLMSVWLDNIEPDNREGGWYAKTELARGRYDRGTLSWEPGYPALLVDG